MTAIDRPFRQPLLRYAAPAILGVAALAMAAFGASSVAAQTAPAQTAPVQPAPVQPAPAAPMADLVRIGDMGFGALLLKTVEEGRYVPAPVLASDVEIKVTGPIARARVTQRFENPGEGWVEGVYVFPLPENAAVDTLKMIIGERLIEGEIKERQEARQIYEQAKAEGKKASLVEQERPNMFTNSVANIGPGETVIVQIEYQERLRPEAGEMRLRFPLVVAPRYTPPAVQVARFGEGGWAVADPVPDQERIASPVLDPRVSAPINPVSLSVDIEAGFELAEIASATHEVAIARNGGGKASVALGEGEVPADRDFELTWKPKGASPQAALFRERLDGEDYLLLMLTPPTPETAPAPRPREAIFVLDISGSMAGVSIDQAKAALDLAIAALKPEDRFNVIWFDDEHGLLWATPKPASPENIATARGFVKALEADGGTEMLPALKASLAGQGATPDGYLRQVIFLTDAAIGNEEQLFQAIHRRLGTSRLFTVGIGTAPNSYFMSRAARVGRGTYTTISDLSQVRTRMAELFAKIERPVMTDVEARWPAGVTVEAWPDPLPDLYAGEPIAIAARIVGEAPEATVAITGELDGEPWKAELALIGGADRDGVAKLWARAKIASLEEAKNAAWSRGEDGAVFDPEILKTALAHHLVSRVTSLVAVDVTPSRPQGEPVARRKLPLNLPAGWEFDKVFGEAAPLERRASLAGPMLAQLAMAPAPLSAQARAQAAPLPRTATGWEMALGLGLLLAGLGLALALAGRRSVGGAA